MGRRGPKPQPVELKLLRGNPGTRTLPQHAARPGACSSPPRFLKGPALTEWKRIGPELRRLGLLTKLDRAALTAYCQAWADLRWAIETIAQDGRIAELPNGTRYRHPAVDIQIKAVEKIRAMAVEFGLTPSARANLEIKPVGQGEEDEWFGNKGKTRA